MRYSTKVFLYFIIIFGFIISIIIGIKDFHDKNNILSNSGIKTIGVIYNEKSYTTPSYTTYWTVYYRFTVNTTYYNTLTQKTEPIVYTGVKELYENSKNHYNLRDTVFVLYSRTNPEISDISYKPLERPEKLNYLTALAYVPQIGLKDIFLLLIILGIIALIFNGVLWVLLRIIEKINKKNMENIKRISIEPIESIKAIQIGVLLIAVVFILDIIFNINLSQNPLTFFDFAFVGVYLIVFIASIIIRFALAIWAYNFADKLNRINIFWAVFTFVFPPIALIILGFLGEKIYNAELKEIVSECRLDYIAERTYIQRELNLSSEQLEIQLKDLITKHEKILQEKLIEFYTNEKIKDLHTLDETGLVGNNINYNSQKKKINESIKNNLERTNNSGTIDVDDPNQCPACGYRVDPELIICPDCGLTLK